MAAVEAQHDVSFFVTGMHMLPFFGLTKIEVHRVPGVSVVEFLNQREGDPQDTIFAKTVIGLSDYLQVNEHHLVVVHGDRVEALAAAVVCATNYVRCAHIEGGEVSGTIDELFRHCNTKLSSFHLVSSNDARRRVLSMGESEDRIYIIGSPELDTHSRPSGVSLDAVKDRYAIPFAEYGIVIFHPVTSEVSNMERQATALFDALFDSGRNFVVINPNNDPGCEHILSVINKLPSDRFRVLPSMRFAHFSELLRNAAVMVGNSSAGVREAPFLGLPSLDIGTRQQNRYTSESVYIASPHDRALILGFLKQNWGRRFHPQSEFGHGCSAENFVRVLSEPEFWSKPLQKYFSESQKHST